MKMRKLKRPVLNPVTIAMAEAILSVREMVPDLLRENEAAVETAIELEGCRPAYGQVQLAFVVANQRWREAQDQAGVTRPIGAQERAAIERALR